MLAAEPALAETERLLGHPLIDDAPVTLGTGQIEPALTIVTGNGDPFRSAEPVAEWEILGRRLQHVQNRWSVSPISCGRFSVQNQSATGSATFELFIMRHPELRHVVVRLRG